MNHFKPMDAVQKQCSFDSRSPCIKPGILFDVMSLWYPTLTGLDDSSIHHPIWATMHASLVVPAASFCKCHLTFTGYRVFIVLFFVSLGGAIPASSLNNVYRKWHCCFLDSRSQIQISHVESAFFFVFFFFFLPDLLLRLLSIVKVNDYWRVPEANTLLFSWMAFDDADNWRRGILNTWYFRCFCPIWLICGRIPALTDPLWLTWLKHN